MVVKKEKKVAKEKKQPLTKEERSEIANRAVQARRKNNPDWGAGIRAKLAAKTEKQKLKVTVS